MDSETEASSSKLQAPPRPAGPKGRDSALPLQGLTAQADPASNHPQSPDGPLCQLLAEGPCFPSPTLHQQATGPPGGAGGGRGSHSGRGVQAGNVGAAVSPCTPQGHKNPIFPAASLWGPPQGSQPSYQGPRCREDPTGWRALTTWEAPGPHSPEPPVVPGAPLQPAPPWHPQGLERATPRLLLRRLLLFPWFLLAVAVVAALTQDVVHLTRGRASAQMEHYPKEPARRPLPRAGLSAARSRRTCSSSCSSDVGSAREGRGGPGCVPSPTKNSNTQQVTISAGAPSQGGPAPRMTASALGAPSWVCALHTCAPHGSKGPTSLQKSWTHSGRWGRLGGRPWNLARPGLKTL